MNPTPDGSARPVVNRVEATVMVVFLVVVLSLIFLGMLIPASEKARQSAAMTQSQSNLYQIGIAIQVYANTHDGRLPDCGILGQDQAQLFFHGNGSKSLSSVIEGNLKLFQAPLDPNLGNLGTEALSYAIPSSWSQKPFNGQMSLHESFKDRGLDYCIGCVEATCGKGGTKRISGTNVLYNSDHGPDPYPTPLAPWSGNASSFDDVGCHVLMMDGGVQRVVISRVDDYFIRCSDPKNKRPVSPNW